MACNNQSWVTQCHQTSKVCLPWICPKVIQNHRLGEIYLLDQKVSDYSSIWSVCTCSLKNNDFWRPKSRVFQRTVPDYVCCPVCFHDSFISKMLNLRHPGHPSGSFSCHPGASRPSHRLKGRQHNSLPPISAAGSLQSVSQHWICMDFYCFVWVMEVKVSFFQRKKTHPPVCQGCYPRT